MKTVFATFVSIALIGIIFYQGSALPDGTLYKIRINPQRTNWCVIENENYAFWDKKFDRYANYWLVTFRNDLPKDTRTASNLPIHPSSAWDYPVNTELADSLGASTSRIIRSRYSDRPKVSKPKE
ncbi:MAG: hypothetical protein WBA23_21510 [Tunicatimonas sp.]|uniref:hypothetical protein n=1 Tax=Tunicatimonas sp. TaxID=1940096 RepID=UPI003C7563AE